MIFVDSVGPGKLFRGPRPSQIDIAWVQFDINLEVGWFEFFHHEEAEERRWCLQESVTYFHRPLSDLTAPSELQLQVIITQARHWLMCGKSVLIHCLHGEDRTGIVIAAYRIKYQGWKLSDALTEMFNLGFHKFPYDFPLNWTSALGGIESV